MMTCCPIFEKFDEEHLLIKEYEYWKLLVHHKPRTLGSCVLITKTHHPRFNELNEEEMKELLLVVKELEGALTMLWKFSNINWLILMMKDKHTHFHIFPRYDRKKEFEEITFEADEEEADPLKLPKLALSLELLQKVRDMLRAQMLK